MSELAPIIDGLQTEQEVRPSLAASPFHMWCFCAHLSNSMANERQVTARTATTAPRRQLDGSAITFTARYPSLYVEPRGWSRCRLVLILRYNTLGGGRTHVSNLTKVSGVEFLYSMFIHRVYYIAQFLLGVYRTGICSPANKLVCACHLLRSLRPDETPKLCYSPCFSHDGCVCLHTSS